MSEEDAESWILRQWGKIKQWVEIVLATKKLAMLIWSLVFGLGGAVVVGEVTDTKPLRDAAIEIGLLQPKSEPTLAQPARESEAIPAHTHPLPEHTHPIEPVKHTHPGLADMPDDHGALH